MILKARGNHRKVVLRMLDPPPIHLVTDLSFFYPPLVCCFGDYVFETKFEQCLTCFAPLHGLLLSLGSV